MVVLINILFAISQAFFRRWFGSNSWKYAILNIRWIKHIVNGTIIFLFVWLVRDFQETLYLNITFSGYNWIAALYTAILMQAWFWSKGHDAAFDMSRNGEPTAHDLENYKSTWFNSIVEFFVPKQFWYQFGYDALWMRFRYTTPCIFLIPIFGIDILFMGLLAPAIYGFCWSFSERYPNFVKKFPEWLRLGGTSTAEYLLGFASGLCIAFM